MAQWGAPPEEIAAARAAAPPPFEVLAPNWRAFCLFCDCRQEYDTVSNPAGTTSLYRGISRTELAAVMSMDGVGKKKQRRLKNQVLLIERGALQGWADRVAT